METDRRRGTVLHPYMLAWSDPEQLSCLGVSARRPCTEPPSTRAKRNRVDEPLREPSRRSRKLPLPLLRDCVLPATKGG